MPQLFGVGIAGEIASALGPELLECKLKKPETRPARSETDPTVAGLEGGDNAGPHVYDFRGMLETGSVTAEDGTIVHGQFVLCLGGTLPEGVEPLATDQVYVEDKWWRVLAVVERDPAAASYKLQVTR